MKHPHRLLFSAALISLLAGCPPASTPDGGAGGGTAATGGGTGGGDVTTGGGTGTGGGVATGGGGGGSTLDLDAGVTFVDAGTRIELAAFCDAWAEASCARERFCFFLDPAQGTTCLARTKRACADWQRAVAAGVYGYTPEQGAACVAATQSLTCALGRGFSGSSLTFGFGDGPAACEPLLVGVGTAGTLCTRDADCSEGFLCTGSGASCRTCSPRPAIGEACDPVTRPCFGALCRLAADGGNACFGYLGVGDACTLSGDCDPATSRGCSGPADDAGVRTCAAKDLDGLACVGDVTCAAGYCNNAHRTDAGVRTCGFLALGRPCAVGADCGPAAFCSGLSAAGPGACAARIPLGSACTIQRLADLSDGCADGGQCFDGLCKPRGQQQVGQQCRDTLFDCARGGWCPLLPPDGGYASCQLQSPVHGSCFASAQCQPGMRCTNNRCELLASAGQPCFATQQCKDLLTCPLADAGLGFFACTPLVAPGGDCGASGATCGSGTDLGDDGFCVRDGGAATCSGLQSLGAGCGANAQCESGRCLQEDGGLVSPAVRGTCQPPCAP